MTKRKILMTPGPTEVSNKVLSEPIKPHYGATEEDHLVIGVSKERVGYMLEAFEKHERYDNKEKTG